MAADAYLRLGDGYFITKDYEMSIEYYDKAVSLLPDSLTKEGYTLSDVDYAQFQKGLAKGVLGDTKA
jgi:tetratricopeptide (TPR) repeat protein